MSKVNFQEKYFQKIALEEKDIQRLFENALRDLNIAKNDKFSEVRFSYSYQALLKAGIALLAEVGQVRVKSIPGHHIKVLEKTAEILDNEDINTIGNVMRMKRNKDLYTGGETVSEKEAEEYYQFVEQILEDAAQILGLEKPPTC